MSCGSAKKAVNNGIKNSIRYIGNSNGHGNSANGNNTKRKKEQSVK